MKQLLLSEKYQYSNYFRLKLFKAAMTGKDDTARD